MLTYLRENDQTQYCRNKEIARRGEGAVDVSWKGDVSSGHAHTAQRDFLFVARDKD